MKRYIEEVKNASNEDTYMSRLGSAMDIIGITFGKVWNSGNDVLQYVSVCCMGSWHPFIDTATGKLLEIWR